MRKHSIIITLLFIFLGGLAFWQMRNFAISQNLKNEIELQEMQSTLMASAIELRRAEVLDTLLRIDFDRQKKLVKEVLQRNFKKFDKEIEWGFFNGLGSPKNELNDSIDVGGLAKSDLKVCTSCLVMIDVLSDDGTQQSDRSFVIDQAPSVMRDVRGMDASKLEYLHLYIAPFAFDLKTYVLPSLFLIGLIYLFIWLLYLNKKQVKLIQQKNEFVNHLSHQFQTPLSSIKLSANLLAKKKMNDGKELIQIIQTESNRLENHIKTVLHWVKSDADRLHIHKEEVSVTDLIEKSIKQMKPVFLTNKTKVNFLPPEDELSIQADANHLQLMLFNIWENAIKHNDKNIELHITSSQVGNTIQISTSDNGKGIEKLDSNIKFKGLGLGYIRRIMNEHGGTMELFNSKTQGLTLNLNFPSNG